LNSQPGYQKDLVLLVPDCNYDKGLEKLLHRHQSLAIRPISFDIYVHMHRDPGCRLEAHEFLRGLAGEFSYALVLFDKEGCGRTGPSGLIEAEVQARLDQAGWKGRSRVLVTEPEFDVWVWSDSPHVERALGWPAGLPGLRNWLRERGFLGEGEAKPRRPKEAMEEVLRRTRRPRSASVYAQLGMRVSVERCADPAFQELRQVLHRWFPLS